MDEETRDDLTPEEAEQMEETPGETPEEAHRVGEYDVLRNMIEALTYKVDALGTALDGIKQSMGAYRAVAVDNGESVVDDELPEEDEDAPEALPDFEDMDLSI